MATDSTQSLKSILDLPQKIKAQVIGNLNLKDRESFALACGALNLAEKATDLCFPVVFSQEHNDGYVYKLLNQYYGSSHRFRHSQYKLPIQNDGSELFRTESLEKAIEFKNRRLIASIAVMQVGFYDLEGFEESLPLWRGIKIEELSLDIPFWLFEKEDASLIVDAIKDSVRSEDIQSLQICMRFVMITRGFLSFIEELPAVPLKITLEDRKLDSPSSDLIGYSFLKTRLARHSHLDVQLLCPTVSGEEYKLLYEAIAASRRGFCLKVRMDFEKLVSFLDKADIHLEKDDDKRLIFSVLENSPAFDAEFVEYNFSPKVRAYFCFFPDTDVLLKLQNIMRSDSVDEYTVEMKKIGNYANHWAWVNETRHRRINPDVHAYETVWESFVGTLANLF